MPATETEKQYNELRKKYKLPEFKEIDFEFELSDLEETNFFLRAVVRRVTEKLDFYSTILEEVLQPDTSNLCSMHETRFFDDTEKSQMYNLYRKLMDLNRQSLEIFLEGNEKDCADFVNRLFAEWHEIKGELLKFVKKMRASWQVETDIKEDVGYLG